ncbi:CHAP domain-containing protein [Myxococcaceae bacterium GXIMD 01537]
MLLKRCAVLIPLCVLAACAGPSSALRPPVMEEAPVPPPAAEAPREEAGQSEVAAALELGPASDGALVPMAARVFDAALDAARLVVEPVRTVAQHWELLLAPSRTASLIVQRAVELVGERNLLRWDRSVPNDCSGFARIAYSKAGIDIVRGGFLAGENAVSAMFRLASQVGAVHHRRPRPGDLVFFRETYDRNRDGKRNDGLTHVGVVEGVERDGTVTFIHRGGKGVSRSRMNLERPALYRAASGGPVLNDYLRPRSKRDRAYLTGELFAAFASADGL